MTATQFTDDAYNKQLNGSGRKPGTLVGNWFEEKCIRDATGEGRRVPQHHIRRSGLLRDFTRKPSDAPRETDDTFERMYGHRKYEVNILSANEVGKPDGNVHVTQHIYDNVQAAGRIPVAKDGARAQRDQRIFQEHAVEFVKAQQDAEAEILQRRYFDTTSGSAYGIPAKTSKAEHANVSCREELLCGNPPSESEIYARKGVDFLSTAYYAESEPVTVHTESAANANSRSNMRVTPCTNGFRRECTTSTPIDSYLKSNEKGGFHPDTQPMPQRQPKVLARPSVTSLTDVKKVIVSQLLDAHGPRAFVELRKSLESIAEADATVACVDLESVLDAAGQLPPSARTTYCQQLSTMTKGRALVAKVLDSLRPSTAVANERMAKISAAFETLRAEGTHADSVVLSQWASGVSPAMKSDICIDFGVPEEVIDKHFVYLNKSSFYEYLVDFSAALDDAPFQAWLRAVTGS